MLLLDFDQTLAKGEFSKIPTAVSIGVFDGLHLGHQKVIREAVTLAAKHKHWKSAVLTFSSNPKTLMGRNPFSKPLMSLRQSTDFFSKLGVDYLVVIDFSPDFSKLSGEAFIAKTCRLFDVKAIVVGDNFRCGLQAKTGPAELKDIVPRYTEGATVIIPETYRLADGTENSSTLVRSRLLSGRIEEVSVLLGRNYSLDLAQIPPRIIGKSLQFSVESFVQLLPPPGLYEALLIRAGRSAVEMRVTVDEEFLTLTCPGQSKNNDGYDGFARCDRCDSLEFLKELPSVC